jgi:hypothetical protein
MVFPLVGSMAVEALYSFIYNEIAKQNRQYRRAARRADIGLMHGEKSSHHDEGMKKWTM